MNNSNNKYKILLVGDYSGVHYEIAEELKKRNYKVDLLSSGDGYKGFKSNLYLKEINPFLMNIPFAGKIYKGILDYSGLKGIILFLFNIRLINNLKNYDVVQIINPIALEEFGSIANYLFLKKLIKNNKNFYLCAMGSDYTFVRYCLDDKLEYSALKSYKFSELGGLTFNYLRDKAHALRYVYGFFYSQLNSYALKNAKKIIPGASDFSLAYSENNKITEIIPLPVNLKNFSAPSKTKYPVKIFLGIQVGKEYIKGHPFFIEAINMLINNYPNEKFNLQVARSLAFPDYVNVFKDCDIFLDQCLGHGIGVNAALGLAAGKVVFSGTNPKFCDLDKEVTINAHPDVKLIYEQLLNLIDDLSFIDFIKEASYDYAIRNNSVDKVVDKYINIWFE